MEKPKAVSIFLLTLLTALLLASCTPAAGIPVVTGTRVVHKTLTITPSIKPSPSITPTPDHITRRAAIKETKIAQGTYTFIGLTETKEAFNNKATDLYEDYYIDLTVMARYQNTRIWKTALASGLVDTPVLEETPIPPPPETGYLVVFNKNGVMVREKSLGWNSSMGGWDNFPMPEARIDDSIPNFLLGYFGDIECVQSDETDVLCTQTLKIDLLKNEKNIFELEYMDDGFFRLKKNHLIIGEGHLNGGTCRAIPSTKIIGDEIAFEYLDSDYDGKSLSYTKHSVFVTEGNKMMDVVDETDYTNAFAPNELLGKLVFFGERDDRTFLVFNGQEIGNSYDSVFNMCCCWDGPNIQVAENAKIIDFFGYRNYGWYHIQVGAPENFDN